MHVCFLKSQYIVLCIQLTTYTNCTALHLLLRCNLLTNCCDTNDKMDTLTRVTGSQHKTVYIFMILNPNGPRVTSFTRMALHLVLRILLWSLPYNCYHASLNKSKKFWICSFYVFVVFIKEYIELTLYRVLDPL